MTWLKDELKIRKLVKLICSLFHSIVDIKINKLFTKKGLYDELIFIFSNREYHKILYDFDNSFHVIFALDTICSNTRCMYILCCSRTWSYVWVTHSCMNWHRRKCSRARIHLRKNNKSNCWLYIDDLSIHNMSYTSLVYIWYEQYLFL